MDVEWRPVPGFEDRYEVSDAGEVRSLPRDVIGPRGLAYRSKGRLLKPYVNSQGYADVLLCAGSRPYRHWRVNRLVLTAFVGPCPDGLVGCHSDGDPGNNNLSNLRWDTPSANERDKIAHGTNKELNKTHCPREHVLAMPNLDASRLPKRTCRACLVAGVWARYHGKPAWERHAYADRKYAKIMSGDETRADVGSTRPIYAGRPTLSSQRGA